MEEAVIVFMSIIISFLLGVVAWIWIFRGFFIPYMASKRPNKMLLRVFLKTGGAKFVAGTIFGDGTIQYKLFGMDQVVSNVEEAVIRCVRNRWMDIKEGDTAPFIHTNVHIEYKNIEVDEKVQALDKDGLPLIDKETGKELWEDKKVIKEVPAIRLFKGWDDSPLIRNALLLATQKPKIPIGSGLGMNLKTILIIVGVIAAGIFITFLLQGGGTPTI